MSARPAGDATNVATDYVYVRGESRSHDAKFFKEITKAYRVAFEKAAKRVKNTEGKAGRVKFKAGTDYYPFRMKESLPVVKRAVAAVSAIYRFQLLRRLGQARYLLLRGGPLADIAVACGFADQAHMSRHFRHAYGVCQDNGVRSSAGSAPRSQLG